MLPIKEIRELKSGLYNFLNDSLIDAYYSFPIIVKLIHKEEVLLLARWTECYIKKFNQLNKDNGLNIEYYLKDFDVNDIESTFIIILKGNWNKVKYPPCIVRDNVVENVTTNNYKDCYKLVLV
jgi:hypothetical protein